MKNFQGIAFIWTQSYEAIFKSASVYLKFNFSHMSHAHILKGKNCFNVKPSTYNFYMKTRVLPDFQICIRVLLRNGGTMDFA